MAAVRAIICEQNTGDKHEESHIATIFVPVQVTLCKLGLKISEFFCTFLSALLVFFAVNIPVIIFLPLKIKSLDLAGH